MQTSWFKKLFSDENQVSSKRFVCLLLVFVQIISLFLLMYFKIEIANKDLVLGILENMFWLSLIFGGFITAEPVLSKLKLGGPQNVVTQKVESQTVQTDNVTFEKKDETLKE